MVAGRLTYDTKMDTKGFQKGINEITNSTKRSGNTIKNIVAGLGITKIISTAMATIKSSLDGAVKRLDTLNNFPKVMENLGISSEKGEKAIKKISDGLKGLPTTLNDGALAVQRFTSTNGDIEKSTDYFLALNNAILAGGAGTELQASALEQLSQAYSKGRADMMEWRTLQMAMPAQLKQVATALGMSVEQLGAGLRNAKKDEAYLREVTMEEFLGTISRLNTEGVAGFKSFQDQARGAIGGVGTSVTNAKTAITRGVANIVDALDKALKKNGFGGLAEVISNVGKVGEQVLSKLAGAMEWVVKSLRDALTWMYKNRDLLKDVGRVILSVVAGIQAYKLALLAIKAINIASYVMKTAGAFISLIPEIHSAKDALTLLGMVVKKNPLGVLVATITAVVTAITVFIATADKADQKLKQTKEAAEEQITTWKDLKKARNEALQSTEGEIAVTKKLLDELQQITDENGKVKEGYEARAKYIVGELKRTTGIEIELNENIIKGYGNLKKSIDDVIRSKRTEAYLNAYKGEYEEAIKKEAETTKTLLDLRMKLAEAQKINPTNDYQKLMKEQAINGINEAIKQQTNLIEEQSYTVEKYNKLAAASVSGSQEEIDNALKDMAVSYEEFKNKSNSTLRVQISNTGNYVKVIRESLEQAKKDNNKYLQQRLEAQLKAQEDELDNLANSLAEQTNTVRKLTPEELNAWIELASRSKDAYTKAIQKVPPSTAEQIQKATGIISRDTSLQNASKQKATDVTTAYTKNLKFKTATKVEMINAKDAIKNNTSIQNASERLGQKADKSFKGSYKIASEVKPILNDTANTLKYNTNVPDASWNLGNSVNKKFWEIVKPYTWGYDFTTGLGSGMLDENAKAYIKESVDKVARFIRDPLHFSEPDVGPLSDFHTYMPDMIDLMVEGIDNNRYKVASAVVKLTKGMQQQMQEAVKLEQTNKYMKSYLTNMVTSMTTLINASKLKISSAIEELSKSIKSGMNTMMSSININSYITKAINSMTLAIDEYKKKLTSAMVVLSRDTQQKLQNAVSLNVQDMNTKSVINSNNMYNSVIKLNASFDGTVEMDGQTTGRIITPYVTRTIKAGGAY